MACSGCVCFKQKTAYEMRISDWSSDVCSSDLRQGGHGYGQDAGEGAMSGDAAALWPRVSEGLRRDLGARTFDHWLKPVRFADYCTLSGVLTLETASRFSANWINERFGDRLELAWRHHLPAVRSVLVRAGSPVAERGAVMAATPDRKSTRLNSSH